MSFSFGSKKSTSTTNQKSQSDPWEQTIPQLEDLLADLDTYRATPGATADQNAAFDRLKTRAAAGNPWQGEMDSVAADLFGATSRSGTVDDAYARLQEQLGGYASGKNLDVASNPYIAKMLTTVGDDVSNRVNQMFAGAGRDITGNASGLQAVARGVTAAQTPILADFFDKEQGRTIDAAKTLYSAGGQTATTGQALDRDALSTRSAGFDAATAARTAQDAGDNAILNIDQQRKNLPLEDLAMYESLLLPVAGLGGQQQGTATTTGRSSGFNFGIDPKSAGQGIAAIATLSDEDAKEDMVKIGETEDGQPIYRYRYAGSPVVRIGLKAQDVEKRTPEAVTEGADGMKRVDYDLATRKAARAGAR